MFKASYNRAVIAIRLETVTPLSVRAGDVGLEPGASDLVCVRTRHARHGLTVYIPGSSMKGVVRSSAEAMVRGRRFGSSPGVEGACNPADHGRSCGRHRPSKEHPDTSETHRRNCLACRTFGSLSMKGRCAVRDHFPWHSADALSADEAKNLATANRVEVRHGVFINRISGSVQHGPFDQEMVPSGVFLWGEIALENYQVWQLGLIMAALDEMDSGFAQLGSSKSRGLGVVRVAITSILHEQLAGIAGGPRGVGDLVADETAEEYGLFQEAQLPDSAPIAHGLMSRFSVRDGEIGAWRQAALGSLQVFSAAAAGGK